MQIMIQKNIQAIIQNIIFEFSRSFEFSKSQNTSTSFNVNDFENDDIRWNSREIDFFDSMYDEKFVVIESVIEHIEKNIYFRDVNDFINRVKNMIDVKSVELIRQNLYICFRDIALTWYTTILTKNDKRFVKLNNDVEKWIRVLHVKFKKSVFNVMNIIHRESYIMTNARRKRESMKYVFIITRAVKTIEMNIYSQIFFIYNDIKTKLRRDFQKSTNAIIMNVFLQNIKLNKKIWWNIFKNDRHDSDNNHNNRLKNNFRSADNSDSYNNNFNSFVARQNDYDYSITSTYNNQMSSRFLTIQNSIIYQFRQNVYQNQQLQQRQNDYQNQN